jgi:hypothetical protein
MITQHMVIDVITESVFLCSVLHTFMPPWDFLSDFPRAQKYYKVAVYVVGYVALNGRSTIYQSLSMKNQQANGKDNGAHQ